MIQSMTGYAASSADTPRGTLSVELRSVNARFLDLQFRISDELRALEPVLRELIGTRVSRGKLDCRLFLTDNASIAPGGRLNAEALARLREPGAFAPARRDQMVECLAHELPRHAAQRVLAQGGLREHAGPAQHVGDTQRTGLRHGFHHFC